MSCSYVACDNLNLPHWVAEEGVEGEGGLHELCHVTVTKHVTWLGPVLMSCSIVACDSDQTCHTGGACADVM